MHTKLLSSWLRSTQKRSFLPTFLESRISWFPDQSSFQIPGRTQQTEIGGGRFHHPQRQYPPDVLQESERCVCVNQGPIQPPVSIRHSSFLAADEVLDFPSGSREAVKVCNQGRRTLSEWESGDSFPAEHSGKNRVYFLKSLPRHVSHQDVERFREMLLVPLMLKEILKMFSTGLDPSVIAKALNWCLEPLQ